MPDQTLPPDPPISIPPLDDIERAGRTEAQRQARLLFAAMMANGGHVDIDRLQRHGPDVQHAYLRLLSREAAAAAATPAQSSAATAKLAGRPSKRTAKRASAQPKPRIEKNWAGLCRDLPNTSRRAIGIGFATSVIGSGALALIFYHFHL